MEVSNKFILEIAIVLAIVPKSSIVDSAQHSLGPKIDSNIFDHILNAGDNFSILCEGNNPLKWIPPSVEDNEDIPHQNMRMENKDPRHPQYQTGLELQLTNLTYLNVGLYLCREKADRNSPTSAIYLFVKDEQHLAAWYPNSKRLIYATEKNTATLIPCKPTSPDVEVTLVQIFLKKEIPIELNVLKSGRYYGYKPFRGIITNDTVQAKDVLLRCHFKRDENSSTIDIRMVVEMTTHSLKIPTIERIENKGDGRSDKINLRCEVNSFVDVSFFWKKRSTEWKQVPSKRLYFDVIYSTLIIPKVPEGKNETYWCKVKDHQFHENSANITVPGFVKTTNITFSLERISTDERNYVEIEVPVEIDADFDFEWLNNRKEKIPLESSDDYYVLTPAQKNQQQSLFLTIKNMTASKVGYYTLIVKAEGSEKRKVIFVGIPENPKVKLILEGPYQIFEKSTLVKCYVSGFPEPFMELLFKPCFDDRCQYNTLTSTRQNINGTQFVVSTTLSPTRSGKVKCLASFRYIAEVEADFYVSDIQQGFGISVLDLKFLNEHNMVTITIENSIKLSCGAYIQNFTQSLGWDKGGKVLYSNKKYFVRTKNTELSNSIVLKINDIDTTDEGIYTCILYKEENGQKQKIKEQQITMYVARHVPPNIIYSNFNETTEVDAGERLELICKFGGRPRPNITWYKDDDIFTSSDKRIEIDSNNEKITFVETLSQDEGKYRCVGTNEFGDLTKETMLELDDKTGLEWYLISIGLLILLVVSSFLTIFAYHRRKKKLEQLLIETGLFSFEEGRLENFDPGLGINGQAELLPYDKRYEFPIQHLVLGDRLGSGAFGVVLKGEARRILPDEEVTTVAVKMVQKNACQTHIKALVSELKILIHLGKHLNVVNLLGACTKNITKREILMIVEYCRFGNVHNYLIRHRDDFIDQINSQTGEVDFSIGNENLFVHMKKSNSQISSSKSEATKSEDDKVDDNQEEYNSDNNEDTQWLNHHWRNYRPTMGPPTTKNLLSWAFQVARGMEYLVSRRILHGDLAARNILLADQDIVKISDFGLSKTMQKTENYKKMSDGPLPVKWMAIESIRNGIFSTQSDIWSFGILLWELFSLSETPYPGMEADENLYTKLDNGYRMEAPKLSPDSVYQIMLECWCAEPLSRPPFNELEERLGFMLEASVKKHYIDLNHPYILMNIKQFGNKKNDYLRMAKCPNYQVISSTPCTVEFRTSTGDTIVQSGTELYDGNSLSPLDNNRIKECLTDEEKEVTPKSEN